MHRVTRPLALTMVLSFAFAACGDSPSPIVPQTGLPTGTLTISADGSPAAVLSAEIAETDETRRIGLMGRTSLATDAGMVFLFSDPNEAGFWMKNTLIPLSIAFWDARGRIVGILDMQPCETDTCPLYAPQEPYIGAVEANLGYFAEHDVKVGDTVELER